MPKGGIRTVTCKNKTFNKSHPRHGHYVQITITDTGIGIKKENLDKIFDPYFSTKYTGNGLGLAITHSIIHKHGGYIDVQSKEGEGTVFNLFIPVEDTGILKTSLPPSSSFHKKTEPLSILVMDDEETIRILLGTMLKKLGHTATLVENGEQALKACKNTRFDLAILDITIPGGMGGIEARTALQKIDPKLKALVSSGYANNPIMSKYKAYGFSAALAKPYLFAELEAAIEKVFKA